MGLIQTALKIANESFYDAKSSSSRDVVGGKDSIDFLFDGIQYTVEWDGFWESTDWYEYTISTKGVNKTWLLT